MRNSSPSTSPSRPGVNDQTYWSSKCTRSGTSGASVRTSPSSVIWERATLGRSTQLGQELLDAFVVLVLDGHEELGQLVGQLLDPPPQDTVVRDLLLQARHALAQGLDGRHQSL